MSAMKEHTIVRMEGPVLTRIQGTSVRVVMVPVDRRVRTVLSLVASCVPRKKIQYSATSVNWGTSSSMGTVVSIYSAEPLKMDTLGTSNFVLYREVVLS